VAAAPVRGNIALAAIDALHRVPPTNRRPVFVARLLVGACLLALAVSVPSLGVDVIGGSVLGSILLGLFALSIAAQLAMIRVGAPLGALAWSLITTVGIFLVASSLTTRELQAQQPYWLVLLPVTAFVLAGQESDDSEAVRTPAPVAVTLLAIGLGILVVFAHQVGLTFDEPSDPTPAWALAVDFVTFMAATSGLLIIHMASARQGQAELSRLRRLLSVCAWCGQICDAGDWIPLEQYVATHERSDLTHGICPICEAMVRDEWLTRDRAARVGREGSSPQSVAESGEAGPRRGPGNP